MTSNIFDRLSVWQPRSRWLLGVAMLSSVVVHAERCVPLADNEYEKIYCELKQRGKARNLPSIYEFRKNPPMTQALLLRKPAAELGIVVIMPERSAPEKTPVPGNVPAAAPEVARESVVAQPATPRVEKKTITHEAALKPHSEKQVTTKTAAPTAITSSKSEVGSHLPTGSVEISQACQLEQFTLHCAGVTYQLVTDKSNQQLPDDALSDDHKLALPVFHGNPADAPELEHYLADAYSRYLQGMLEIGLGSKTMTYTKFANLYDYYAKQHLDFVSRFETMYEFLKKDKATVAVSTRPQLASGFNLQYCSQQDNLIACDYQKTNYVFAKSSVP